MDKKSSLTQMKPLSYADQSNNERELPQNGNSSTKEEVLILPKASSWTTVNFDLDFAALIADIINSNRNLLTVPSLKKGSSEISKRKIKISQADYYFIGVLINLLCSAKNYVSFKDFSISITEISNVIFGFSSRATNKLVKKDLFVMSLLPIYGQNKIMSFSGKKGHYPTIQFGPQFELFYKQYLRTSTHDFVKIPKTVIKNVLAKVIKVPKALCMYLEITFLETKNHLEELTEGWTPDRTSKSDNRIYRLFSQNSKHSVSRIKSEGCNHLKKLIGDCYLDVIKTNAIKAISSKEKEQFINTKKAHIELNTAKREEAMSPNFEIVNEAV